MKSAFDLRDRRILLTGASSGIGRATAIAASEGGAQIVLTGRSEERLQETLSCLHGEGHSYFAGDLTDADTIERLVKESDNLDGIVHSAGVLKTLPFKFSTHAELRKIMEVNLEAPFVLTQKLLKKKKLNHKSSIVFVSSLSGAGVVASGISMYSASKGAINALIKVMALELAPQKIRVNSVSPGMVKTDMNTENATLTSDQLMEDEKRNYPLGYGQPEDVANPIVFLLSDASKWITGTTLILDGGASIH